MRYAQDRTRGQFELAASVNACPMCLGDLVPQTEISGLTYFCIQCETTIAAPRYQSVQPLHPAVISSITHHSLPPVHAA